MSVMPSNNFILCCPFLLLPSIFPTIRVFTKESILCIRWPKFWTSALASIFPMNFQDWFPLGLTGLISLQSKWLSRSSPTPQLKSITSALSFLYSPTLTSIHDHWKNLYLQLNELLFSCVCCYSNNNTVHWVIQVKSLRVVLTSFIPLIQYPFNHQILCFSNLNISQVSSSLVWLKSDLTGFSTSFLLFLSVLCKLMSYNHFWRKNKSLYL